MKRIAFLSLCALTILGVGTETTWAGTVGGPQTACQNNPDCFTRITTVPTRESQRPNRSAQRTSHLPAGALAACASAMAALARSDGGTLRDYTGEHWQYYVDTLSKLDVVECSSREDKVIVDVSNGRSTDPEMIARGHYRIRSIVFQFDASGERLVYIRELCRDRACPN